MAGLGLFGVPCDTHSHLSYHDIFNPYGPYGKLYPGLDTHYLQMKYLQQNFKFVVSNQHQSTSILVQALLEAASFRQSPGTVKPRLWTLLQRNTRGYLLLSHQSSWNGWAYPVWETGGRGPSHQPAAPTQPHACEAYSHSGYHCEAHSQHVNLSEPLSL